MYCITDLAKHMFCLSTFFFVSLLAPVALYYILCVYLCSSMESVVQNKCCFLVVCNVYKLLFSMLCSLFCWV